MELWLKFAITIVCGYLLGSINPAIIFSKMFVHQDIRTMGSGNAGSTNAIRTMGGKRAIPVILCDILKTVIAAMIGQYLFGGFNFALGATGRLAGGVAAIVGHVFPLYYKFKGGKGVMAAAACVLCYDWRVFLIAISMFFLVVIITKYVSLGSIVGVVAFASLMIIFYPTEIGYIITAWCVVALVVWLHRGNIKRLLNGTESKFGTKKK